MSKDAFNDGTIGELGECLSWINAYKNSARGSLKNRKRKDFEAYIKAMEMRIADIKELLK